MAVFGIDLGTTYSVIATLDENKLPKVIENQDESKATLASAVYFPEDGGTPVVGTEAKNIAETDPDRVAQFIKRYIGKANADEAARRDGLYASFDYNGQKETPITISSWILKRLVEYASQQGYDVEDVVITCPAYFTDEERRATRQAGENIGLNVLNIINEPTAAALSYCYSRAKESKKILVYDLGGGTFDVTVVDLQAEDDNVVVDAIRTGGNDKLGGVDWDKRLYDYLVTDFTEQNGIDVNDLEPETLLKIRQKVESTKMSLSSVQSKTVSIVYDDEPTKIEITREKFAELTKDLVDQTMYFVDDVLDKAGLTPGEITEVLLVGGSTLMPMINDTVTAKFPDSKVIRTDPHLAVAKGAAIFAGINVSEQYEPPSSEPSDYTDGVTERTDGTIETVCEPPLPPVVKSGFTVKDSLSHSYGPAIWVSDREEILIDNIAFIGDQVPIKSVAHYSARGTSVEVDFYSNDSEVRDGDGKYVMPTFDVNDNEQWTDPALNVRHMGKAVLDNPNIEPDDAITVIITVTNKGSKASVCHDKTGETKECEFKSDTTQSEEETLKNVERFKYLTTRSDA
jgi:molecular chaperone DnaK (HSP70)